MPPAAHPASAGEVERYYSGKRGYLVRVGLADVVTERGVFATNEGVIQRACDYWILGQGAVERHPRWSIVRNVPGWVD